MIGRLIGLSDTILGLTILSWGGSLGGKRGVRVGSGCRLGRGADEDSGGEWMQIWAASGRGFGLGEGGGGKRGGHGRMLRARNETRIERDDDKVWDWKRSRATRF